MRAALVWSLLVALAPLAGGQDQERYELSWLARDRATFVVDIQLGEATTRRLVEGQPDDAGRRAAGELWAAQQLAAWRGPLAWAPVDLEVGRTTHLRATGWLATAAEVGAPFLEERRADLLGLRLGWYEEDGRWNLVLLRRERPWLPAPSPRETLRLGKAALEDARRVLGALIADDWRREELVVLRAPIARIDSATRSGHRPPGGAVVSLRDRERDLAPYEGPLPVVGQDRLTFVQTSADERARAERRLTRLAALAGEVEAGRRSLDDAATEDDQLTEVRVQTEMPPEADPAAVDSFTRGLEAARAAWAASPWRERVEQAATPVPLAGVEPLGPLAPAKAQAPAAPSVETAPVLAPGEHALSCDLEAWGRIEARAGQTVRVEVRPQGDVDLDLELWADGATRRELVASSAAGTPVEAASWRVAKDGPVWARVWKGTGRFTLVVRVE